MIESTSLIPCMANSRFSATLFNITFSPDDATLSIRVNGIASMTGKVTAKLTVIAYGFSAMEKTLDPCDPNLEGFQGMCPMTPGQLTLMSTIPVDANVANKIPAIAYQVPDIDGIARIQVFSTDTKNMIACVEAPLSNNKTVDQNGVGWITALVAGLGLIASAVTSGLGHSNTAAHVAANAVSLFGYFQAQAMIGMTAVQLPPVVAAWTQNFGWTMGIIRVNFMQNCFHWYIQATGGTPANLQDRLSEVSVQVAKRSIDTAFSMSRAAMYGFEQTPMHYGATMGNHLVRRSNNDKNADSQPEYVTVSGISRVAFKAKIEITNFFITGLTFFVLFLALTGLGVSAFKGACEFAIKMKWIKGSKFVDFRNGWLTVLKGIMYRLVLIGFPQMIILCLFELSNRDSAGVIVLAVFFLFAISGILVWAAFKVVRIAQRSVSLHKNPAYILYSDPAALNRWGFLYVQFRASSYYYIVPLLIYFVLKAMFIAFGQKHGSVQAIGLVVIELSYLGAVAYLRPWMDQRTNIFNISICVINSLNAIFLLVFSNVFNSPMMAAGVVGVIFFVMNAAFALVLLILVLVSSVYALASKNPDVRYQPMRDDRGSFIKSNSQMLTSTELDALGATARGEAKTRDLDDDDSATSPSSSKFREASQVPLPPSTANSARAPSPGSFTRSPVDPSVPLFPLNTGDTSRSHSRTDQYNNQQSPSPDGAGAPLRAPSRGESHTPVPRSPAPSHTTFEYGNPSNGGGNNGQGRGPQQHWHVGAGYDR